MYVANPFVGRGFSGWIFWMVGFFHDFGKGLWRSLLNNGEHHLRLDKLDWQAGTWIILQ